MWFPSHFAVLLNVDEVHAFRGATRPPFAACGYDPLAVPCARGSIEAARSGRIPLRGLLAPPSGSELQRQADRFSAVTCPS
jgi:hypothetical protein